MIAIMSESLLHRLARMPSHALTLPAGAALFRIGDAVTALHLVDEGEMRLERATPDGGRLILQRAAAGELLAEASCFSRHYHCDAVTAMPATLTCVPLAAFRRACAADPSLGMAFAAHLAASVQNARARAEMLALKTVPARLDAWLALNGGALPPKGRWRDLAAALGVTQEALYRELARRRKDLQGGAALRN